MYNAAMTPLEISNSEFQKISELIYKQFGIHLTPQKVKLVEGRLQKIVRKHGFEKFADYFDWLTQNNADTAERMGELVDRMSTNHTFFWREASHFELLEKKILPEMETLLSRQKKIRVWCAASSSGQEPYTILMAMMMHFGERYVQWDAGILGTDISRNILDKAELGIYSAEDVEQLPPKYRNFGFDKTPDGEYQVKAKIRKEATYRRFNLMNPMPFRNTFDIIFCRNVMIYFDNPTKKSLIERMFHQTSPNGYFFTSLSESLDRSTCPYKYIQPGLYQKA